MIIYISSDHYQPLLTKYQQVKDEVAAGLDTKDAALHRSKTRLISGWLEQIHPLRQGQRWRSPRLRLLQSWAVEIATEAAELAHINPSAKPFADYLERLVTDPACWVGTETR